MRVLSFDWHKKKALTVYDSKSKNVKEIPNTIEQFEKFLKKLDKKVVMLFEFGGGDTYKILAFRAGHKVIQIIPKAIKDYRVSKGKFKDDVLDARTIYDYFRERGGSATGSMKNISILSLPSSFYLFQEQNADIAEIKILFREHEDLKQQMVREKLKLISFKKQFEIARVADERIKKLKFNKEASIIVKEKEVEILKKTLKEKVKQFDVWTKFYENIKGTGSTIIAGLIGELGGRIFDGDNNLKHFAGMVTKREFHNYNRYVKANLFQFAEQVIKHRIPHWRKLYDNMKIFYSTKHPKWTKRKVDNYTKKFIETKFLLEFWHKWKEMDAISAVQ